MTGWREVVIDIQTAGGRRGQTMTSWTKGAGSKKPRSLDMINAEIAIKRATLKAREDARKSGVPVVIWKDGKIIEDWNSLNEPTDR